MTKTNKIANRLISMLLCLSMLISIVTTTPFTATASENEENDYSGYPEKLETLTKQYLMYATGENSLQLNSTKTTINGNLYTGGNLDAYSARVDVYGKSETVGHVNKHEHSIFNRLQYIGGLPYETTVLNEETGEEEVVTQYTPGSESREYPNFTNAVVDSLGEDYAHYQWWHGVHNTDVTNNSPIYVQNGGLQFTGSTVTLQDTIIADNSILISASTALNTAEGEEVNLYVPNGNIGIYVGNADINGIIYAPNGTVQICGTDININGAIIAKEILISAETFTISENYNLSLSEHLLTGKVEIPLDQDSDKDLLPDYFEVFEFETDPFEADTDGDGLDDGLEVLVLEYNPLSIDSDNNGVSDSDEDYDSDGLTNIDEVHYGTDLTLTDSDEDSLTDGDEVHIHGTNPANPDTDGDGISDGDEPKIFDEFGIYLDPLNPITDGITPDGERILPQQDVSNASISSFNEGNAYNLSISVNAAGWASNSTTIQNSGFSYIENTNPAVLGKVASIDYRDGLKVENVTLSFKISENELSSPKINPNDAELAGIKRYAVFRWYEEYNVMLPVSVEYSGDTLIVETDELGDYFIVDVDRFYSDLEVPDGVQAMPTMNSLSSFSLETTFNDSNYENSAIEFPNEKIITFSVGEGDDIVGDDNFIPTEELFEMFEEDDTEQFFTPFASFNSTSFMPFSTASSDDESFGAVDVVFAIDCSDNLGNNFDNAKQQIIETAMRVSEGSEDARFAVVGFDFNNAYMVSGWTRNINTLTTRLNSLEQTDETWSIMADPLRMVANDLVYRSNAAAFGVLIFDAYSQYIATDEDDYDFPEVIDNMVDKEINFSILISNKTTEMQSITRSMVTRTNGYIGTNTGNFSDRLYRHIAGISEEEDNGEYIPPVKQIVTEPSAVDVSGHIVLGNFSNVYYHEYIDNDKGKKIRFNQEIDSDEDTLYDYEEVDWINLMINSDGSYSCRTYYDWVQLVNPQAMGNMYWHERIKNTRVLTVFSNPWNGDSDGDGLSDNVDYAPTIYNTIDEIKVYDFLNTADISEIVYMLKISESENLSILSSVNAVLVFRKHHNSTNRKAVVEDLKDVGIEITTNAWFNKQGIIEYHTGVLLVDYDLHRMGMSFEELTAYWSGQQQQVIDILLTIVLFEVSHVLNPYDSFGNIKYKPVNEFKIGTAESANKTFINNDYKPPFKPGTKTYTVELTKKTKVGEFVRVYSDSNFPEGQWFMRASDIKGLNAQQIQDKFALPETPTHVCDVILEKGTVIRYGTVNGIAEWGQGGALQIDLLGERIGQFINGRLLP